MDFNPYAPPGAVVADVIAPESVRAEPPFFAVSTIKLFVMCVCTFGLYELFWSSRQWKAIARRERRTLNPYLRSTFAVFYCYPCFASVRDHDAGLPAGRRLGAGLLASGFVITTLCSRLPEPYSLAAMFLPPLILVAVQQRANELNAASIPSHDRNSDFSAWNWVAVFVGGLLLAGVSAALIFGV